MLELRPTSIPKFENKGYNRAYPFVVVHYAMHCDSEYQSKGWRSHRMELS